MNKKFGTSIIFFTFLVILSLPCRSNATASLEIEGNITKRGYELSESGMRKALQNQEDFRAVHYCLLYIAQEQLISLVPDVQDSLKYWEGRLEIDEGSKLLFIRCLLAIDKDLSEDKLAAYLKRIRRLLYDVKKGDEDFRGVPIHAYNALLAAQEYWDVDIYEDLLYLCATDTMYGGEYPFAARKLFELYGGGMPESDLNTLLEACQDRPGQQEFILRRAREHGMRLESDDAKGNPQPSEATPLVK